jgi:CubicO group peptidase (beta-lactamase class C family)
LYNWQKMTNLIATQAPLWSPGKASGYHAVTWGYLPGELIKRITGESLGAYFRRKIGEPLQADCYIGLPDAEHDRCATLNGPNRARRNFDSTLAPKEKQSPTLHPPQDQTSSDLYKQSMLNPVIAPFKHACSPEWRRAEIAASNGHASARGLAKIYAALSMQGELSGTSILSSGAIDAATLPEVETSTDLVMNSVIRRSRGFILNTDGNYGPNSKAFGHNGTGGSTAFADRENGVSLAYVMNQMLSNSLTEPRANRLTHALFQCIKQ